MKNLKILILIFFLKAFFINFVMGQETKFISIYLYNFTKYIEWKNDDYKENDFVIGVFGHSDISKKLSDVIKGQTVGSQKIIVKNFKSFSDIEKTHILFIADWKSEEFDNVLSKIKDNNTLVVTNKEGMLNKGAAINFVKEGELIKFEISTKNAEARNMNISNNLIAMAFKSDK